MNMQVVDNLTRGALIILDQVDAVCGDAFFYCKREFFGGRHEMREDFLWRLIER